MILVSVFLVLSILSASGSLGRLAGFLLGDSVVSLVAVLFFMLRQDEVSLGMALQSATGCSRLSVLQHGGRAIVV